ncbi:unnamed protein product [marine sediment metagenome]|uniref:FCP1 homology domain-containing protein n=1 Tax=marine sediment metagenome TaxID=412755 RepID=X0WQC3_9ZZZZ
MNEHDTVCVDLDGTLAKIDEKFFDPDWIGEPLPGALELLERLEYREFRVVLFTCRMNNGLAYRGKLKPEELIQQWLEHNHMDDYVDEIWEGHKPFARFFIDDRGITFQGGREGPSVERVLDIIDRTER